MNTLLEICIDSVESAIKAEQAGADRLELCENLLQGGLTPSLGKINAVIQAVNIPVRILIRPRAGDFFYSEAELNIIAEDIKLCTQTECEGVVVGALNSNSEIDEVLLENWKIIAQQKKLAFHRAFDVVKDPLKTAELLIQHGFDTILTSGQRASAEEGVGVLSALHRTYGSKIKILAGGGVRAANISKIHKETGITHFHSSAKTIVSQELKVSMGSSSIAEQTFTVNSEEIRKMKNQLNQFRKSDFS